MTETPRKVVAPAFRSRVALALAVAAAAAALVLLVPPLTRLHWIVRLSLRETSGLLTLVAGLAWITASGHTAGDVVSRVARGVAAPAALVGLLPFLALASAPPASSTFSPLDYVLGSVRTPSVRVEREVILEPAAPALTADVYHAPGRGPHPFVVVVHGGSWRGGDKGEVPHLTRRLAAAGFTAIDVRYRLAPAHPFPQGIGDVKCLLGRLRERAGDLRLDPTRAALLGRSAGGQIALVGAYSTGDRRVPPTCVVPERPVQAVVALYPPTDLVYGHDNPMVPDVVRGTESLRLYLGGPPRDRPEAYRLGSPMAWLDRAVPPTLLIHGDGDHFVGLEHSQRLATAMSVQGHRVRLLRVRFGEHGFDARPGGVGEQIARRAILDFLGSALRPSETAQR